ncbi:MAG: HEAT repeat domain-containing protein [Planctomycetes bacterium]|nr:HEAT repeat domain-containing protein [Planctomycetota bacterium]
MKFVQFLGLTVLLCSVDFVMGGGGVGIPKKEDVPKYLKQLQTSISAADRAKAAEMLGKRGGINADDVEEAVEPLKKALQKDKDSKVRVAAARALGNIHSKAKDTVPILIDRLKNDDVMEVKMATVVALGQYGAEAKEALPDLRELAKKFDAKKSKDGQTVLATIKLITGAKMKKT